ncbi:plasmid replication protein RepC [uncultured Tateyamaria sp.]|uniref:plasmid replication protein RepC n=1 Tax=uncultured Tateyamaria sp. TaxID=455651 RepID=UPI0026101A59|nr:plasmid replication protein RepC [uncultured Tateyamaria sp.]
MERLSTTPFGQRPVTADLLKAAARAAEAPTLPHVDKWELLRSLCAARDAFAITDREIGVLEALLSFHPEKLLGGNADMVVFPSNRALSDRCHGMAESTLRRHLARLVDAGLILRHDSPNGKRYARRDPSGEVLRAFGFDLRPLLVRAPEIAQAAEVARAAAERLRTLREKVSLQKRDAQKLALYGLEQGHTGPFEGLLAQLLDVTRMMRRKLSLAELDEVAGHVSELLEQTLKYVSKAEEMSGNDASFERQYQSSNTDSSDLEPCLEKSRVADVDASLAEDGVEVKPDVPIPLGLVLRAVPEALEYAQTPVTSFADLARLGAFLRGMIGVSPSAWDDAVAAMGVEVAGITICCLLQRIDDIRSPGGYLRKLTLEAQSGKYSVSRVVMALIQRPQGAGPKS